MRGKIILSTIAIFIAGAVAGGFGSALVANGRPAEIRGEGHFLKEGRGRHGPHFKKLQERMAKKLELTSEQQEKIRSILEGAKSRAQALREEQRPRWKSLMEENRQQIRAVLTPEQQEKFDEMRGRFEKRLKERGEGRHGRRHWRSDV